MKLEKVKNIILASLFLNLPGFAFAQGVIANRSALNTNLGASRIDEGFESLNIADDSGVSAEGLISSTNTTGSWVGGLIVPGLTIESGGENLAYNIEWDGNNNPGGSISKTIVAGGGSLTIDFWNPTSAFGIDLKDSGFRYVLVAGVTIFGPDDSTVLYSNNNISISDPNVGTFFGFEAPQGIGSVYFYMAEGSPGRSPRIDNLSFSTAPIPEPSAITFALLGLGAFTWRLRKK